MKNIFQTLAFFGVSFYIAEMTFLALPACASCPIKLTENTTGAACSVQELGSTEKNKNMNENLGSRPKAERDLRPIRVSPEIHKSDYTKCVFGTCVYRDILSK